MPMNKIPKLREPRGPVVQQVRDMFLENEYKKTPDEFYEQDIKLIMNMDFLLQRFVIMQRKNVESSVKMVSEVLKWRKSSQLYELSDQKFPQELTIAGAAFLYENDKFGNRTLYLRASMCKKCTEMRATMKEFLTYLMFKLDDCRDGTTYAVIMDLTNASMSNYDIDLMIYLVSMLKDYFPVNLDYFLAINLPWILSAGWALIKRLIPAEKRDVVQFIGDDKICDFVERENLPDFLGGTCQRPYSYVIPEAPTAFEFLMENSKKAPTKKRLYEILDMFSDSMPKDHIEKLELQLKHYDESTYNNTTNEDLNKSGVSVMKSSGKEQLAK